MFFPTSLLLLATAAAVSAEIHDITVGDPSGTLAFNPPAISAVPGDQVVFHFQQKNHSATQSSFASPCGAVDGGFDSGFHPVMANQTDNFPTYTITVNDTKPIWVFCDQAANTPNSHCGAGMVFAVNCGADGQPNSFTNFKAAALKIGADLKAAASSVAPASTSSAAPAASITIPPAPEESLVTVTVTVEASTWTTTYSSYPGSAAPTPASLAGNVHVVKVGNNGTLSFDPPTLQAMPRDIITFEFHQKNHTATQSAFASPCVPFLNTDGSAGLDSGFMPVADNATTFPTWNVTVNDTAPIWFFCDQHKPDGSSHCGAGMVFSVNPVESSARNSSAFKSLAISLNGTASSSNGSSSTTSGAPASSSTAPSGNGAAAVGMNLALGLGSVLAIFATML